MKLSTALLATLILTTVAVWAEPPVFKSTLKADEHDQPVFTSPTNDSPPAVGRFTNIIAAPAITNWDSSTNKSHLTNWPARTNPPALKSRGP